MWIRLTLVLIFGALVAACDAAAQQTLVPEGATCPRCKISARPTVSIGDMEGPGAFSSAPAHVTTDRFGRFLIYAEKIPQVFDARGRFLSDIGRPGKGPGEIFDPGFPVAVAGDSILVIEPRMNRASLFGPDLQFARQIRLPGSMSPSIVVLHWPDSVVFTGQIHTRERFGFPIHLISLAENDAQVLRSGGDDKQRPEDRLYVLAVAGTRQVWGSRLGEYRLDQWNTKLTRVLSVHRDPKWWSKDYSPMGTPTSPPTPIIQRVLVDQNGLLWVFVRVAGKNWRDGWPASHGEEVPNRSMNFEKLFGTVIEVIDPAAGRVVTRSTLDFPVFSVIPGPRAIAYKPTPEGVPQLHVLNLSIVGR